MRIGYLVALPVCYSRSNTLGTIWAQTGMFHLKLLINFLSLSIAGSNWLACLGRSTQDRSSLRWRQVDLQLHQADPSGLLVCLAQDEFSCRHMFWHARWDTTIVLAAYNNNDILTVPYEDLPDGDKDVISKAIEEFQNKCLLSYTKTRDNTIVQKYPLPRVLLHG